MNKGPSRQGKAVALLAAMLFLLVAASFHSAADNDLARFDSNSRLVLPSSMPAPDTCAACTLDGLLSARISLTSPVVPVTAAETISTPVLLSPFVAPRASVDSRPPPPVA